MCGEEGEGSQRDPPTSRTSELRSDSLPRTQPLEERLFFRICSSTLSEVRQEWRGAEATIAFCMESLKRSVLGAHNCALSPFYILMTRYSSQIFFVWDSRARRIYGWTFGQYSHFHVQAGRGPLSSYKRLNAKTINDSFSTGEGQLLKFKSHNVQCRDQTAEKEARL